MKLLIGAAAFAVALWNGMPAFADYAAIYQAETREYCSYGAAHRDTEADAKAAALALCKDAEAGSACRLAQSAGNGVGDKCIAVAEATGDVNEGVNCYATGSGATQAAAERAATNRCQVNCTPSWSYCTVANKPAPTPASPPAQCQTPDVPGLEHNATFGDCFFGTNVNPEGTACTYKATFNSTTVKSETPLLPPHATHVLLACQTAGETVTFVRWDLQK